MKLYNLYRVELRRCHIRLVPKLLPVEISMETLRYKLVAIRKEHSLNIRDYHAAIFETHKLMEHARKMCEELREAVINNATESS